MSSWFLTAASPTGPSHTADTGAPETLCGLVATVTRETDARDIGGPIEKCGECITVLQGRRAEWEQPEVDVCSCAACEGSSVHRARIDELEEGLARVCPGCHAVAPERCAPGCIDAEIAEKRDGDSWQPIALDEDDDEEGTGT